MYRVSSDRKSCWNRAHLQVSRDPGPEVVKLCPCSIQRSMKFKLKSMYTINVLIKNMKIIKKFHLKIIIFTAKNHSVL